MSSQNKTYTKPQLKMMLELRKKLKKNKTNIKTKNICRLWKIKRYNIDLTHQSLFTGLGQYYYRYEDILISL